MTVPHISKAMDVMWFYVIREQPYHRTPPCSAPVLSSPWGWRGCGELGWGPWKESAFSSPRLSMAVFQAKIHERSGFADAYILKERLYLMSLYNLESIVQISVLTIFKINRLILPIILPTTYKKLPFIMKIRSVMCFHKMAPRWRHRQNLVSPNPSANRSDHGLLLDKISESSTE